MTRASAPTRVSVILCAYTQERWGDLVAAVRSVQRQSVAPHEVIVVADHDRALMDRVREELPGVVAVASTGARGLSGARNSGVARAGGTVLAFIDDDAIAEPDWLACLLGGYRDAHVLGVGGSVVPMWAGGRPRAFPEEFDWVVGCTYRGMPERPAAVRNVIGANMSFRRDVFEVAGGFREGIGRVGTRPVGCEETELCLRARRAFPDGLILYDPRAVVHHRVPAQRASWRYFGARCYSEGISKALVSQAAGLRGGLSSERAYAARTLPLGIAHGVADAVLEGDVAGIGRAAAVVAGLSLTTAGFAAGAARTGLRGPRRPHGRAGTGWLEFDVHGRATLRVAADAPGAPQLRDMLGPFRTAGLASHDITVTGALQELEGMVDADADLRYRDDALELPRRRVQVIVNGRRMSLNGPGELLAPLLALVDTVTARRGAAMVHAAAVSRGGRGVCLAGSGSAGKTSTAVRLVREHGFEFMGDDWAFVAREGQLLGYAKPLFIRPHHRALLPHLFTATAKPLAPARVGRSLGGLATAVHPAVSRHPRVARAARRWSPEHRIVGAREALQGGPIAASATLAATIFLERGGDATILERREASWMASRLLGSFFAELPRGSRDLMTALGAAGLLPIERGFADKAGVLRRGLSAAPAYRLRVPRDLPADAAADVIAAHVRDVLGREGVAA